MTFEKWDVVVVPFPFTDRNESKRRPALVLSNRKFNGHGHTVMAMITSSAHGPWPGDTILGQYESAGLDRPCTVRLKLFTLDNRIVLERISRLSHADAKAVAANIAKYI